MKGITKKAFIIIMALMIALVPMTAFAATGLNSYEQMLLDEANAKIAGFTLNPGQKAKVDSMVGQVVSYMSGDYELTEEGYNACVSSMNTIVSNLPTNLADVSISGLYNNTPAISGAIDSVAATLGIVINVTAGGTISMTDKNGNEIGSTGGTVQQTGVSTEYLFILAFAFIAIMTACAVVAKKKNLFVRVSE